MKPSDRVVLADGSSDRTGTVLLVSPSGLVLVDLDAYPSDNPECALRRNVVIHADLIKVKS
jgi:hypothetical protein